MKSFPKNKYFKNRKEFHAWLSKNHKKTKKLWLLFYKKNANKPGLLLSEAVEEALCYGWIDSTLRKIDERKHIIRFTPRNPKSVWSKINKERVLKLI